jgi:hypothetical protein
VARTETESFGKTNPQHKTSFLRGRTKKQKTLHYDRESEKQARLSEQNKGFVRGKEKAVDSDLVRGRAEAIDTMRSAVQSNY